MAKIDLQELEKLINEWLLTLNNDAGYWDGVYCSDRDMVKSFLVGDRILNDSFLEWLKEKK